jgi:methyl-accepting chemotaxis protein
MTVNRKIAGGYTVVLALVLLMAVGSYLSFKVLERESQAVLHLHQDLIEPAIELQAMSAKIIASYRAFFLYPDRNDEFLDSLRAEAGGFDANLAAMRNGIGGDGRRILEEITALQAKRMQAVERAISLSTGSKRAEGLAMTWTVIAPLRKKLVDRIDAFRDWAEKEEAAKTAAADTAIRRMYVAMSIALTVAILFGVAFAFVLSRSITAQLRESFSRLSAATSEILSTSTQVGSGAAETATAVAETNTTVEQLKQASILSSQKAKGVSESAQKTSQVSQDGKRSVDETGARIRNIQEQMTSIAECILKLSEQGQLIGEIMSTVNDLAEQSNLLAVNAAIEAAKAGDQGRGFAVVAQEVRSLAVQSKQATTQVRAVLNDVQKATGAAVMATEQGTKSVDAGMKQALEAGESIRVLAAAIAEAAQAAIQIAASSQQQLAGAEQIAIAMDNIRLATEQNVTGVKQVEQAARSLSDLGVQIRAMVESRKS